MSFLWKLYLVLHGDLHQLDQGTYVKMKMSNIFPQIVTLSCSV
jgi:hypothetical protein